MTRLLITAAALALLAGAAHAQPQGQPPNPDTNRDGKVTFEEFKAMQAQRTTRMFARMDADKDGKITAAEMQASRPQGAPPAAQGPPGGRGGFMMRLDANKDGAITKAEFEAGARQRFDDADTNDDGWLSRGEVIMLRQRMGPPGGGPQA